MRYSFLSGALCCGVMLACSTGLYAQSYGYPAYGADSYYGGRAYDRSFQGRDGTALFEHVEDDLNRASMQLYGTRRHINHARKEVEDVQRQLRRGRFDRGEMGEAIRAVQHVIDNDPLPNGDRSMLGRDVAQMRYFRDREY